MKTETRPIYYKYNKNFKRRTCMLMVTHSCNLNCSYCYEQFKCANKEMTFETAKRIIEDEFELVRRDNRFDELEIDFMGGEPLMNFALIKQVVEWLEGCEFGVPFICFATTNATLLDEEKKAWFLKHRETIWLGGSLDGTMAMQRKNRGEKALGVDVEFLHSVWPEQDFHSVVSKETLPNLAEGILEIQKQGSGLGVVLAQGVEWCREDAIEYKKQLGILIDSYLNMPNMSPIPVLKRLIVVRPPNKSEPQRKFCGTGTYMATYDWDGNVYGCHMFSPVVLGDRAVQLGDINWSDRELASDSRCDECVLREFCPTCAGFNFRFRGEIGKRDMHGCLMSLAEAQAACEYQIKTLQKISLDEISKEEMQHAKAAIDAYDILNKFDLLTAESPFSIENGKEVSK